MIFQPSSPRVLPPIGEIEAYHGPMFARKSENLLADVAHRAQYGRQRHQIFHPARETRRSGLCWSRFGAETEAAVFHTLDELWEMIDPATNLIAIDEVQFADQGIVGLVTRLRDRGQDVLCAGLDFNFRGEPFGPMAGLINLTNGRSHHLHAWCAQCGRRAYWSQLLVKPPQDGGDILVGDNDEYEARCERCFVPQR